MSGTILERIVASTRERVARLQAAPTEAGAPAAAGPGRFTTALQRGGAGVRIIAEVKRASPSLGLFAPGLDAGIMAEAYRAGGAAALSVLTEPEFFHGSAADLRAARAAGLPVLRKDFLIDPVQVPESARMGADAVLLIAAILEGNQLGEMIDAVRLGGLDALVEVHDEGELARALQAGAGVIGVNCRDLRTFRMDRERAVRLAAGIPEDRVRVAESGVRGPDDVRDAGRAGYDAVLVGEHLIRSGDPGAAVRELAGA